jgi:hypothetical protein
VIAVRFDGRSNRVVDALVYFLKSSVPFDPLPITTRFASRAESSAARYRRMQCANESQYDSVVFDLSTIWGI